MCDFEHKAGVQLPQNLSEQERSQLCPVVFAIGQLGGKWKLIVLHNLVDGPMRFGELRRAIPDITQRMLTLTLRELEEDGIVNRKVFEVVPPHVEYSMTDLGQQLAPVMDSLRAWGRANFALKVEAVA
ncbi:helix-turn-helix domain-containing protein [Maritalea porphyrae]|uniref:winged helix-turn-helix transcriptional regulator n=1 Tax=Maritalea porphyrae TaxID=880732 RepID=UPI0022B026D8|nr:helix-turn-helix domain-containing protein [Maritalea porphyrae]MCZ4272345.1 helix-turn-helix domain-containing protein [Maritalea porphyrae]